jgi:hypothetical protein
VDEVLQAVQKALALVLRLYEVLSPEAYDL